MSNSSLSLTNYNGKELTNAEILLTKYYENKKNSFYSNEEDIIRERMFLAQTQRLLEVPTLRDSSSSNDKKDTSINNNYNDDDDDGDTVTIKANTIEELKRKYEDNQNNDNKNKQKKVDAAATVTTTSAKSDNVKNEVDMKKVLPKQQQQAQPKSQSPPQPIDNDKLAELTTTTTTTTSTTTTKKGKIFKQVEDIDTYSSEDDSIPDFYSSSKELQAIDWNPSILNTGKSWELTDFNMNYKQTVILKVTVPKSVIKWTINISPTNNIRFNDILFHSNFRQSKHSVIFNDKVGTWGDWIKLYYPKTKTTTYEVMIQMRKEGFCLFIDNNFFGILTHRRDIDQYKNLILSIPAIGDDFESEEVIVHKIWWGYKSPDFHVIPTEKLKTQTDEQKEKIPDTPYYDRTLFISGLPQCTDRELQYSQENALREIFPELEAVAVPPFSDKAFVRFPSPSNVDSTIEEFEGEMQMAGEKGGIYVLKLSKLSDDSII